MNKNTLPVKGGAMFKIDRSAVMTKAWEIFRKAYDNPAKPFARFSRKRNFGHCLALAWQEAKAAAETDATAQRQQAIRTAIIIEECSEHWPSARRRIRVLQDEMSRLQASA